MIVPYSILNILSSYLHYSKLSLFIKSLLSSASISLYTSKGYLLYFGMHIQGFL